MISKTIRTFVSDMVKRGEAVLKKSSSLPGKIMEYRPDRFCYWDGVWTSRDAQTGEAKRVSPGEMTRVVVDGVDVPHVFGQDELPKCVVCRAYEDLHRTRFGWMCETCIQKGAGTQDQAQKEADAIQKHWSKDAKKDRPIQSDDVKEDE